MTTNKNEGESVLPTASTTTPAKKKKKPTKKQMAEAAEQSMMASQVYMSRTDLKRHIHEGIKPYQRLADQAGLPFLSYLIGMAVEESKHDPSS